MFLFTLTTRGEEDK